MPDRDAAVTETPDLSIMDGEKEAPPVRGTAPAPTGGAVPDPAHDAAKAAPEEQVLHDAEPQREHSTLPQLWPEPQIDALRDRWREVQLHFVDDPRKATEEADTLVVDAVKTLTAALDERRTNLADWKSDGADETERLRVTVQRYRDFLDRVLAL